jgi:hypothetical protein
VLKGHLIDHEQLSKQKIQKTQLEHRGYHFSKRSEHRWGNIVKYTRRDGCWLRQVPPHRSYHVIHLNLRRRPKFLAPIRRASDRQKAKQLPKSAHTRGINLTRNKSRSMDTSLRDTHKSLRWQKHRPPSRTSALGLRSPKEDTSKRRPQCCGERQNSEAADREGKCSLSPMPRAPTRQQAKQHRSNTTSHHPRKCLYTHTTDHMQHTTTFLQFEGGASKAPNPWI